MRIWESFKEKEYLFRAQEQETLINRLLFGCTAKEQSILVVDGFVASLFICFAVKAISRARFLLEATAGARELEELWL